jgi:phenylacetate-coenzyme A ligase PaaK-like adenylate-forming protein
MTTPTLRPHLIQDTRSFFGLTYQQHKTRHAALLQHITETAPHSPIYSGRLHPVAAMEDLSSLPLTFYESIAQVIDEVGTERAFLTPHTTCWQTSGYTGEPKRMYFGTGDVERCTQAIGCTCLALGVRPWHSAWSFGAAFPLLSGSIIDMLAESMDATDYFSTPVNNDRDFIKALRRISRHKTVDIMTGPPLLFQMITRMAHDPGFYRRLAAEKARKEYRVPAALAKLVGRLYLSGIDPARLQSIVQNVKIALSFSEPMQHYVEELRRSYPQVEFHDFLGSTEVLFYGVQFVDGDDWLSLLLQCIIPEIADPADVLAVREGRKDTVTGVPWYEWQAGMRGELIVTRAGDCLPLLRYPTGDLVEVVDPAYHVEKDFEGQPLSFELPAIRMLGRSVDAFDFEVPDEMGIFPVGKIFSRDIQDAATNAGNVRWWELHFLRGSPGRLVFLVIPDGPLEDEAGYREHLNKCLHKASEGLRNAVSSAQALDAFDLVVAAPEAYLEVQAEIDRRIKEKRNLGQIKPRHIFFSDTQDELDFRLAPKLWEAVENRSLGHQNALASAIRRPRSRT